jgi:Fic family protein
VADEGYQPFPDISAWAVVPFDPTTYEQYAALLEQARASATEEAREHAVKTAIRYAGTDTGAIEGLYTTDRGFTRTVAIEAAHWEAAANERGPNAAQIIKDQIEAYEWVLDLVTESRPVTEHVIRELHTMLCRHQDTYVVQTDLGPQERPLPKGEYKAFPNNPTSHETGTVHHYAPPDSVAPEMQRLVASLSTDEYRNAHPVVQAAYLHYTLAAIHPFADGNGRTTRALASVPLYRALRMPFLVLREDRDVYLDRLGEADRGDLGRFVSFVAERVTETVDLVLLTLRAGAQATQARTLERLREIVTPGGLSHAELDAMASRLLDLVFDEVLDQIGHLDLPPGVTAHAGIRHPLPLDVPQGYRSPRTGPRGVVLSAMSAHPASAEVHTSVHPLVATNPGSPQLRLTAPQYTADFEVRDIEPVPRTVTRVRISRFVEDVLAAALVRLTLKAEVALQRRGYLG